MITCRFKSISSHVSLNIFCLKIEFSRIRFIRHSKGPKKSDEYAAVTNRPNTITRHLNRRAISRGYENVTNMPVDDKNGVD